MAKKVYYKNIEFDSTEEIYFYMWCEEAKKAGYLTDFRYHDKGDVFKLIDSQKMDCPKELRKQGFLTLSACHYELDFMLFPSDKLNELAHGLVESTYGVYVTPCILVDVKGWTSGKNEREFKIKQKLMLERKRLLVNRVIPWQFFEMTWIPERAGIGKRGGRLKNYKTQKTLRQLNNFSLGG